MARYSDTSAARAQGIVNAAHRAVDDPAKLARAARIVRAALARQKISLDELTPLPNARERDAGTDRSTAAA